MQVHVHRSALWVCCFWHWRGQQGPRGRGAADRMTGISQWPLLTSQPPMVSSLHAIHLLDHVLKLLPLKTETGQKLLILKGRKLCFLLFLLYIFPVYSKCHYPLRRISLYPIVY